MVSGLRTIGLTAVVVIVIVLGLAACAPVQQATVSERNAVIGESSASSNFYEALQIKAIEEWKDNPAKIVNLYIINPVTGDLLVPPVQCMGVPVSSTESLEPNEGHPFNRGIEALWQVPIDGADVGTTEMAGRDGTFGDPAHFRQCMTVDGHYIDIPAYGLPYIVTSQSYTFASATVQRDFESEARLLVAEEVLRRGGCVNPETLTEVQCQGDE